MKEKFGTFIGVVLLAAIFCGIVYLTLFKRNTEPEVYSEIKLKGNHLLSAIDYLANSNLDDLKDLSGLSLQEIKSRIENHPYLLNAEVHSDGNGAVIIRVYEKEIIAVLLAGSGPYLITEKFDLILMNKNSDISNLPVISNANLSEEDIKSNDVKNPQLICAFKIIDAAKFVGDKMYNDLAEINLRDGGDVILKFSGVRFPVILGKGCEGEKILVLSSIWNGIKNNDELFDNCNYVDLRFSNKIFIGNTVTTEISG
jgi:cell division septal protein FtsQ